MKTDRYRYNDVAAWVGAGIVHPLAGVIAPMGVGTDSSYSKSDNSSIRVRDNSSESSRHRGGGDMMMSSDKGLCGDPLR